MRDPLPMKIFGRCRDIWCGMRRVAGIEQLHATAIELRAIEMDEVGVLARLVSRRGEIHHARLLASI